MSEENVMPEAAFDHGHPLGGPQRPLALREALVDAIGRRRRRIRTRVATGCLAGVVAATALGVGLSGGGPSNALAIETTRDWIEVRIVDADAAEAASMTEQLQEAGIDIEVRTIPAPADLVGSWMGLLITPPPPLPPDAEDGPGGLAPAPPPLLDEGESRTTHDVFSIRRDAVDKLAGHHFVLYLGRAPESGESPQMLSGDGPHPVGGADDSATPDTP